MSLTHHPSKAGSASALPARRRPLRACAALAVAAIGTALSATPAFAHAVVRPSASRPAELQLYTLTVPTEREVPTTGVDVKVPAGIDFLLVEDGGRWRAELVRANGRVDQIHWRGSSAGPGYFATFRFVARNPIAPGQLTWKIVQRYEDGKDVFWIGGATSDSPAAVTTISEQATPVDTLTGLNGGQASFTQPTAATPQTSDTATVSSSVRGRDALTLTLAIAAFVAALAAVGHSILAGRGRS